MSTAKHITTVVRTISSILRRPKIRLMPSQPHPSQSEIPVPPPRPDSSLLSAQELEEWLFYPGARGKIADENRRSLCRHLLRRPLAVQLVDVDLNPRGSAWVIDLNTRGAGLQSSSPVELHSHLGVVFSVPGDRNQIFAGEVRWHKEIGPNPRRSNRFGVEFLVVTADDARFANLLCEVRS